MSGFITKETVLELADLIVELYGIEVYKAALEAEGKTFLQVLAECRKFTPQTA